jgi:PAS domain S-box-containing protein
MPISTERERREGEQQYRKCRNQCIAPALDLTQRKRPEEDLCEAEQIWRAVFENGPIMCLKVDAAGTVLWLNSLAAEQLGYSVDELTGVSVLKFFHADDRAVAQRNMARCLDQLGKTMIWELRNVRKDGSILWVRETARAMLTKDRPVVLMACEDITEFKRTEEELQRSEVYLEEAQRLTHTGSWAWDPRSQKVLYCSEDMFRIFGVERESLPARKRFQQRVHPDDRDRVDERFARSLREKVDSFDEYRVVLDDGTLKYINSSGHPVLDDDGELVAFVGTAVDVTERKREQDELQRLRRLESDLAHLNRLSMMGELSASLVHEITQPIATAGNNARAAMHFLDRSPPDLREVKEALACIAGDSDRARDIIDRIRDQIKKAPPRMGRFDLNEAINEVIILARSAITENDVSVRTQLTEVPLPVQGDRVQLQQVVMNLILNAIEAMSSTETATRELLITTEQSRSGGVLVAVRDSGPGIDPQHLERVFKAFCTTKSSGMGMGLSICRAIIDSHGGRLWADVNAPRGAVFRFTLPNTETLPGQTSEPTAHFSRSRSDA